MSRPGGGRAPETAPVPPGEDLAEAPAVEAAGELEAAAQAPQAPEQAPQAPEIVASMTPRELFEVHCSACHALNIAVAQRLDRATWEWVVEDMVEQYGATWLTDEERETIIDYATENYGRKPPGC